MKKGRNFQGVLYPDSTSYDCQEVLDKLSTAFPDYAYILHDKDINEDGTPKKPHYHWLGSLECPVTIKTISNKLGVAENAIEFCKSYRAFLRYLIHLDHPDKAQYKVDDVQGHFNKRFLTGDSEQAFVTMAIEHISDDPICTIRGLAAFAARNNSWSEFRRNYSILKDIMYESRTPDYFDQLTRSGGDKRGSAI